MLKRHLSFTIIFLLIASAYLYADIYLLREVRLFVKPLICISLAIYLILKVKMDIGFNRLIFGGLALSFFGDCFLMFALDGNPFFMYGLLAFVMAHILYSLAFFRDFKNDPQASKIYGHLMLFVMGAFSLSYYSGLRDSLGGMRIPVMAYMFVMSIMAILAGYRHKRVNALSFRMIYIGAIFFVISDSILAYNKFVMAFPYSGVAIMGTYMLAQYLITLGAIERVVVVKERQD